MLHYLGLVAIAIVIRVIILMRVSSKTLAEGYVKHSKFSEDDPGSAVAVDHLIEPHQSDDRSLSGVDSAATFYDTLGIQQGATSASIVSAYRRLAMKWHPDKYTADTEKRLAHERFVSINEAFHVLRDATSRAEYDEHLRTCGLNYATWHETKDQSNWNSRRDEGRATAMRFEFDQEGFDQWLKTDFAEIVESRFMSEARALKNFALIILVVGGILYIIFGH